MKSGRKRKWRWSLGRRKRQKKADASLAFEGQINRLSNRQTDRRMDRGTEGRRDRRTDRWTDGQTDRWMDKQTNGWKVSPFYRT